MILGIRKTRATNRERIALALVHIFGIGDALVYLLSFGVLSAEWRVKALFSDWLERIEGNEQDEEYVDLSKPFLTPTDSELGK